MDVFVELASQVLAVGRELDVPVQLLPLRLELLVDELANFAEVADHLRAHRLGAADLLGRVLAARRDQVHEGQRDRNSHHDQRDGEGDLLLEHSGDEDADGRSREGRQALGNFTGLDLNVKWDLVKPYFQSEGYLVFA